MRTDRVLNRGRITRHGLLQLQLLLPQAFRPSSTDVFTVLTGRELMGSFANVRNGRIDFGFGSFDVLADNRSLRLLNVVAAADPVGVPAPTVAQTFLLGAALVLLARRVQQRRRVEPVPA